MRGRREKNNRFTKCHCSSFVHGGHAVATSSKRQQESAVKMHFQNWSQWKLWQFGKTAISHSSSSVKLSLNTVHGYYSTQQMVDFELQLVKVWCFRETFLTCFIKQVNENDQKFMFYILKCDLMVVVSIVVVFCLAFFFFFFKWNWHISCTTLIFLTTRIPNLNYSGWLNHFNYPDLKHIQYSYKTTLFIHHHLTITDGLMMTIPIFLVIADIKSSRDITRKKYWN